MLNLCFAPASTPVPVVLWHGMGDTAAGMIGIEVCRKSYMPNVKLVFQSILKENIEGVYVHRIMIGGNIKIDKDRSYYGDANRQISEVC